MEELLARWWQEMADRPDGPFAFRFYLQPLMAVALAMRDGIRDAREGRAPYFWSLLAEPARRREALRSGWTSIGRVVVLAAVLDVAYQLVVLHGLRPAEGLVVAVVLAVIPYLLLRGLANRIARAFRRPGRPAGRVA